MGLEFRRTTEAPHLQLFTDAVWANDTSDRKSISGQLLRVHGCPVHWSCKRQTVVAKSPTTAEYIAADMGLEDLKWTVMLIYSLTGVKLTKIPLMIDNLLTIQRIKKEKMSNSQKSVDIAFHSIKDAYQDGTIKLAYCPTSEMLADGFTKALGKTLFCHLRSALGLVKLASTLDSRGSVDATDESGTNPSTGRTRVSSECVGVPVAHVQHESPVHVSTTRTVGWLIRPIEFLTFGETLVLEWVQEAATSIAVLTGDTQLRFHLLHPGRVKTGAQEVVGAQRILGCIDDVDAPLQEDSDDEKLQPSHASGSSARMRRILGSPKRRLKSQPTVKWCPLGGPLACGLV
ncbi:hypothetical protein ON010_g13881 [Phytophthora cinnamomi]|nr:hypothetical protein ON010_g13881 [Phytophthora cinnamomi]